jgi:hypothetical protein
MSEDDFSNLAETEAPDYLRLVTARDSYSNTYLMHWRKREMPLSVYLPSPPPDLFTNPEEVYSAVRRGILDWAGVVEPGIPSFEFVDDQGDADIPIVWAKEPTGDWYIAFCAYDVQIPSRFGVSHILVTGRWGDGHQASIADVHAVTLHEVGHALGLMGHSDNPTDIMYRSIMSESARMQLIQYSGSLLSASDRQTLRELYEHGNRPYRGRRDSRR